MRQVMKRKIDAVKLISKRWLICRRKTSEAVYTSKDTTLDHGILLSLLASTMLFCKNTWTTALKKNKNFHSSGGTGRGSLVTLFSKTTVNTVIETIRQLIQVTIASEVGEAGMFSLQIETTQDLASRDQYSVIIRCVTERVNERLLAVVDCESATGENLFQSLARILKSSKIDIRKCVGTWTDGASNMQGKHNGFFSRLSKIRSDSCLVLCTLIEFSAGRVYRGCCQKYITLQSDEWHCSVHSKIMPTNGQLAESQPGHAPPPTI